MIASRTARPKPYAVVGAPTQLGRRAEGVERLPDVAAAFVDARAAGPTP